METRVKETNLVVLGTRTVVPIVHQPKNFHLSTNL